MVDMPDWAGRAGMRAPQLGMRNPEFGIRNPKFNRRKPKNGRRSPKSGKRASKDQTAQKKSFHNFAEGCKDFVTRKASRIGCLTFGHRGATLASYPAPPGSAVAT